MGFVLLTFMGAAGFRDPPALGSRSWVKHRELPFAFQPAPPTCPPPPQHGRWRMGVMPGAVV